MVMKKIYKVAKKFEDTIYTPYGEVLFSQVRPIDVSCDELESSRWQSGVSKGDRVRIVAGRKNPIGTEGTVKWCGVNNYGSSYHSALDGKEFHLNPSIRLTLDDGSEVWTCGNNCINLSFGEPQVFENKEESKAWEETVRTFYEDDVWYLNGKDVVKAGNTLWGLGSQSYGIYQGMLKEGEKEVAAVIDDFSTDRYMFVKFSKEAKHGNEIEYVSTGTVRNMDDMWRGDTGLTDAIKAFENCKVA